MATRSQSAICAAWARSFPAGGHYESGRTVDARGNVLRAAWGSAELARYLPAGRKRTRAAFLVTGDRWGAPGWGHTDPQTETRLAVADAARAIGADVLLIPFAALEAARVDMDSIRPLEVRPDKTWTEWEALAPYPKRDERRKREGAPLNAAPQSYGWDAARIVHTWKGPDGRRYRQVETLGEWRRFTFEGPRPELRPDGTPWGAWEAWPRSEYRHVTLDTPRLGDVEYLRGASRSWGETVRQNERGEWGTDRHMHRLGDALFMADVVGTATRAHLPTVADVVAVALRCIRAERAERGIAARGNGAPVEPASVRFERFDVDAPISETVETRRRVRFVSSFDMNERAPLYFLATLPRTSRARTVADAIEDLAPPAVHAALARGAEVLRQGDIFAIPTNLTDADLVDMGATRARLSQWTRGARARKGEVGYRRPLNAADRRRIRAYARRRFAQDFRALLADATPDRVGPQTVRARRRSWDTPGTPRPRDRDGYRRRYGTNARAVWERALAAGFERFAAGTSAAPVREPIRDALRAVLAIHGTSHGATEVARVPGGAVYVRGVMRHEPSLEPGRRGGRDHAPLKLGDGTRWYLAVRNTVPRLRDAR